MSRCVQVWVRNDNLYVNKLTPVFPKTAARTKKRKSARKAIARLFELHGNAIVAQRLSWKITIPNFETRQELS